jgi:16S rRNA (adenine1518-N6/adenine1519-N6)-dimethyltransferase
MPMSESPIEMLRRLGLQPKKSWGQNFLGDETVLERIVEAALLEPGEPVVELGAGLGHLTRFLLATKASVTAVERDRDMIVALQAQKLEGLSIIEGNAATVDLAKVAGADQVTVVGNLPYHLTSSILFLVLDQADHVKRAVFTLQKEVVDRLAATPGGRDYGILSVLLGLRFDVERCFLVPAAKFHPPPKVDSAVVRLTRRSKPRAEIVDEAHFRRVVKAAFAQRRKMIINSLQSDRSLGGGDALKAALVAAGIDSTRRAETVSVEEFAALERALPLAPAPAPTTAGASRGETGSS